MSAFETACPDCGAAFEVDEEYRGQQADCPSCACLFLIPQTGRVGTKINTESLFSVSCPKCGAAFEVPNEYRGEQADCTSCGTLFTIPATGNKGEPVSAEPAAPPAPAAAPRPGAPPAPKASAVAAPQPKTTSGIQAGTGADAAYKKSGTVRLSRAAILENVMKPQLKDEAEKKGPAPAKPTAGGMAAKPRVPPPPAAKPSSPPPARPPSRPPAMGSAAALASTMASEPIEDEGEAEEPAPVKERKPGKKVTLPGWAPDLRLGKRETLLDYKSGGGLSLGSHRTLSLLPVILIPIAVLVTGALPAILSALAFTAIGGIVWAIYAFVMLPGLNRRGLVVTTRRAIMIEEDRVAEIEIAE